jgi:protein-disulfide isomerase
MHSRRCGFIIVLAGAFASVFAQSSDIRSEISIVGASWLGDLKAKVTIVEFSDYQCPLSSQHFNWTMGQIVDEYVKTGKLKYVFRDFPLESIHPLAPKAAEAAHCAGEQGKYWEMHDRFLRGQLSNEANVLLLHGQVLRLDVPRLQQCIDTGAQSAKVRESVETGKKAGVQGTPAFFLGLTDPDGRMLQAVISIAGAQPYDTFKEAIDKLLSKE